jgi:hypothetical protein
MKFYVITATEVQETNRISFGFMFDSKSNFDEYSHIKKWGAFFSPNKTEIAINLFESDKGLVFGWGNFEMTTEWTKELIQKLPEAVILMSTERANLFCQCCNELNIEYKRHDYNGVLKTG